MHFHQTTDRRQFVIPKPAVGRQGNRVEPELRVAFCVRHVNVRRLIVLETVEEEPVTADSEQYGHGISLRLILRLHTVTNAAPGSSALSSTRPSMTFPDAIRIRAF